MITFPTSAREGASNPDSVAVVELATGRKKVVARTGFDNGLISSAVSAGDWTVYVDESEHGDGDGPQDVLWRVRALNRKTRESRVLESNGSDPDPFAPGVSSADGYVYWDSYKPGEKNSEYLWRPEWSVPREVPLDPTFDVSGESIDDDWFYFVGNPRNPTKDERFADCWRMRLDGTGAERLTESGFVMTCTASGSRLVWNEHINPQTQLELGETESDDPYDLWTRRMDGGSPVLLHRGYVPYSTPIAVGDYVVWQDEHDVVVSSADDPEVFKVVPGVPTEQSALYDGETLALLTRRGDHVIANVVDLGRLGVVLPPNSGPAMTPSRSTATTPDSDPLTVAFSSATQPGPDISWAPKVAYFIGSMYVASLEAQTLSSTRAWDGCPRGIHAYAGRTCPISLAAVAKNSADAGARTIVEPGAPATVGCDRVAPLAGFPKAKVVSIRPDEGHRDCFSDFAITLYLNKAHQVSAVNLALSGP